MICFHRDISSNYAWELVLFHKLRQFADGISFFECKGSLDWFKADHNPKFEFFLVILNFTIIEFNIYNVNHVENTEYETCFPVDKER